MFYKHLPLSQIVLLIYNRVFEMHIKVANCNNRYNNDLCKGCV